MWRCIPPSVYHGGFNMSIPEGKGFKSDIRLLVTIYRKEGLSCREIGCHFRSLSNFVQTLSVIT